MSFQLFLQQLLRVSFGLFEPRIDERVSLPTYDLPRGNLQSSLLQGDGRSTAHFLMQLDAANDLQKG